MIDTFHFIGQLEKADCGLACLRMISFHYNKEISATEIRHRAIINENGISLYSLAQIADALKFRTNNIKIEFSDLKQIQLPCILYVNKNHFIVLYKIKKNRFYIADPSSGKSIYYEEELKKIWSNKDETGSVLCLTPLNDFSEQERSKTEISLKYFKRYFRPYKLYFFQIIIGMFAANVIQLFFPFLAQALIDNGVNGKNLSLILIILIGQTVLTFSRLSIEYVRSWIFMHIGTRINLAMISDFYRKLLSLEIPFFSKHSTGEILQRISDYKRIETFISNTTLNVIFSASNFVLYSIVLIYYNYLFFLIFLFFNLLHNFWIISFTKKRREIDSKNFENNSKNQNKTLQLFESIQDIKLNSLEIEKREEWESIQAKIFRLTKKTTILTQLQTFVTAIINEIKNIAITILAATSVVDGRISLGEMISIQFILGQLNTPLSQMIALYTSLQDTKNSFDRIKIIHNEKDEDQNKETNSKPNRLDNNIIVDNLKFKYPGTEKIILKNISFTIPHNKVTAIVGSSGSGKTSILKLLLKFDDNYEGVIDYGTGNLKTTYAKSWRALSKAVLQDSQLFSDTIGRNIYLRDTDYEETKLRRIIEQCHITDILVDLPLGINTLIGPEGKGLSQGQKQRILIARALYSSPSLLILDEATNSLDNVNEKQILDMLYNLTNTTIVIVAHRMNCVKKADQIIVLDNGSIVGIGTHNELQSTNRHYQFLFRNQSSN